MQGNSAADWLEDYDDVPLGKVEAYWIELPVEQGIDPHDAVTRANLAGILVFRTKRRGPLFRTTFPVEGVDHEDDQDWSTDPEVRADEELTAALSWADEAVLAVEWVVGGRAELRPYPTVLDSMKFVRSKTANGAEVIASAINKPANRRMLLDTDHEILQLYLKQFANAQRKHGMGDSPERTRKYLKEFWSLGDVGAAEKYVEDHEAPNIDNSLDWVTAAEEG